MSEIFGFEKSPLEELRDLLPGTDGFDFGTSPHGLPAGLPEPYQETPEASSLSLSAKPVLTLPVVELPLSVSGTSAAVPLCDEAVSTARSAEGARAEQYGEADSPGVYRSPEVHYSCCCLRKAVFRADRTTDAHSFFPMQLTINFLQQRGITEWATWTPEKNKELFS